ncbi:MAG: ATPase, T2SS/T4P/T4SS family [Burkholderiaceae bacterium]
MDRPPPAVQVGAELHDTRHIQDFARVPPYERILSVVTDHMVGRRAGGGGGDMKVLRSHKDRLVALGQTERRFVILSTLDELHSSAWYHLIQAGKAQGLSFCGYYTAEPEIFQLLFYKGEETSAATDRAEADSARAVQAMVAESSPLEWFRGVIHRCLRTGASDLHLEVRGAVGVARVRLDGLMRTLGSYPARIVMNGVSSAFTVLAEERSRSEVAFNAGIAQAAMIPLELPGQRLTLRYQSHPAVGGMDVVIRLLRANSGASARVLTMERLGYTPWQAAQLIEALGSAWGGVFIAGVTGSGKTTTLNTMLAHLAREGTRKLITIEDPVEYEMAGVSHLSVQRVSDAAGVNPFHNAMLAFLRMDPDVGLFGEIRDALSARMAQVAIQTGHKIPSTVHATSALGVIGRLASPSVALSREDLCNPEFISALVYQVLMPLNCEHCKVPALRVMSTDALQVYQRGFDINPLKIYCASDSGCPQCRKPGIDYGGSTRNGTNGVKVGAEVIVPDLRLLELLQQGKDVEAKRYWRSRQQAPFSDPDMGGKEAWGHVLYDIANGRVDPFHFERTFGSGVRLAKGMGRT